jgi:hypothetical protein
MKRVIFALTSARSGTLFLRNLFRRNIKGCCTRHEPFFDWGNPTLLGPTIYDAYAGRLDKLRGLLAKKRDYINRLDGEVYLESNHAFLKSAYLVALEFFPEMGLIHLIRDPLRVAKSEAYREAWRRRVHAPLHYYRGDDGRRYFFWSLTGNEEIFEVFDPCSLSLFQRYLIQWVEIENRAMSFLSAHALDSRCFRVHAPGDLNNPASIRAMFEFFSLRPAQSDLILRGRKNKSLGTTTIITGQDEDEASQVLCQIPARYLEIFRQDPYVGQSRSSLFLRLCPQPSSSANPQPVAAGL